jgi:hypothetical protein
MDRKKLIQRAVYSMVAIDVFFLLLVVLLSRFVNLSVVAITFAALFIFNRLLRRKLVSSLQAAEAEDFALRSNRFSLYVVLAIFFAGSAYGALMISQGELPRTILPLLLVPLFLAVYCLKTASRKSNSK